MQILIVEDEQLVADDLRETLENLGYNVPAIVSSGEEAIVLAETLHPDLVLMDIRLEGEIDGIEASFEIQSRLNLPVVYLTANADRATLERAKSSHPFGYILKPFDERILAVTIEIALARHQTEIQVKEALITATNNQQIAESKSQMTSENLYIAAHEFRNPLATIRLSAEMLKVYGEKISEEKKQNYIHRIESATDSLTHLLDNILTLGSAESENFVLNPTPLEVVSFCEGIVESLGSMLKNQYEVSFSTNTRSCVAYLDEQLLGHILNNFLSNAVKYSPKGSTVSLILNCDENTVCFQIKDQGVGIPLEFQEKLFEPFQRAANVGKIPGTGLGLAIVKRCVELHQGTITVDSSPGRGTNFIVTLPLKSITEPKVI